MARDKKKDDELFNCGQKWERSLVAGHYGENEKEVLEFLEKSCDDNAIKNSTHLEVYELIEKKLGYKIPASH